MSRAMLAGVRVLVVEDDFYLAADADVALTDAGAIVLGPFGDEESALSLVEDAGIDCAVLDVNLGPGPSFRLAHAMQGRGIPFLFVTGYDREAIPKEFAGVRRLQKPCNDRELLGAVRQLV